MTKKAHVIAADIAAELKLRLASLTITESVDTDQSPLVKVGTGASGAKGCLIKVVPQDWPLAKDILGLTANVFAPHKIQLVFEANFAGTTDNVADNNSWVEKLAILGVVVLKGTRVEIYESPYGATVGAEDIVAGNLKATFDGSLQYGMLSNQ